MDNEKWKYVTNELITENHVIHDMVKHVIHVQQHVR